MGIRRVVTGHDDQGKAVFASDEVVEPVTSDLVPGMEFFRLWGNDEPSRFPDDGSEPSAVQYFPPLGGYRFGLFTVPPDSTTMIDDLDFDRTVIFVARVRGPAVRLETNRAAQFSEPRHAAQSHRPRCRRLVHLERHGLLGMRERVTMLGGDFRLETRPGAGTRIELTVRPTGDGW